MSTITQRLLFISFFSLVTVSCRKSDWKHFFDSHNKDVVSEKNLPLTGDQEVPIKNTPASGEADVRYNKKTKVLQYSLSWKDLTGEPTGAHIHGTAPRGVNAGIRHDFFSLIPKTTSGTFSNSVIVDEVAIKEDSLLAGYYYFNIHTPTNPGGEIRGQIEFD